MENLTTSAVTVVVPASTAVSHVHPIATISGVSNVTDVNLASIVAAPNVPQVVSTGLPTISQVWYNCGGDGVPQLLTNPQSVVEITSADLARQFNQHLQTPYGNIQVQVQPVAMAPIVAKQEDISAIEVPVAKPVTKRVRVTGNERVPCLTCGKTVSCNATLRDHMRTHTGDRPFVCSECGFAFAQRSNLRMHKRLHTGERPYMCGICGKTFARSSHLPAHMRTHTGEKPYVCEECDHAFITAQQLKNHFRVHTGEKPWKCEICPAAFTHSSSLSTHKKKHTGMKPYQCEKCQKCFFFTSALDKHMKVHSKARPFKCLECDKSFKYKESLTVHREKYCGKESSRKPRAPRRADARKPGPKPGIGRKYVQKKKCRPRGRPRKRGRWSTRVKARRNYQDMEDPSAGIDSEGMIDEGLLSNTKEEEEEDDFDDNMSEGEIGTIIPTAELKVEVLNPEDGGEILGVSQQDEDYESRHIPEQITGDIIEMQPANEIHIDGSTALTIVSAEHGQQIGGAGMQLVTLGPGIQFVQQEGDNHITHQLVTRDGIQMWYPRH